MHDENEGTYQGGEGTTPVTTACAESLRVKPPEVELESRSNDQIYIYVYIYVLEVYRTLYE